MVVKGLKVGATFEDGGNTYKVIEVLENGNYISKKVDSAEVETEPKKEPTKKTPPKKGK